MILNCDIGRLLRVLWTARRSNQSILRKISPAYSLEGLMLKLKLQYFGYLIWRTDSLEKILMVGKTEGGRRRGDREWDGWMASPTQWTWVWVNSRSWWWTQRPSVLQSTGLQRIGHDWATELNWTDIMHGPTEVSENTSESSGISFKCFNKFTLLPSERWKVLSKLQTTKWVDDFILT